MERRFTLLIPAVILILSLTACREDAVVPSATPTVTAPMPPPEDVIEERWRAEGEIPEVLRIDVSIPKVREDLPGAADVNGRIEEEYDYFLDREVEDYDANRLGFGAPDVHIWYEVYCLSGIYEICIRGEEADLRGSGPLLWTSRYCYDYENGAITETSELLERLGCTEQDVVDAFYAEMVEDWDPEEYTYEDIQGWYYIDGEGELHFTVSLYA